MYHHYYYYCYYCYYYYYYDYDYYYYYHCEDDKNTTTASLILRSGSWAAGDVGEGLSVGTGSSLGDRGAAFVLLLCGFLFLLPYPTKTYFFVGSL